MFVKKYASLFLTIVLVSSAYADWKSDADARIESMRKRNAQITVLEPNGNPAGGVNVQIEQITHRFGFGSCINYRVLYPSFYPNYDTFFRDHFEWATCENETKWPSIEPLKDSNQYGTPDNIYNWCNTNGIPMRGHCLFWDQLNQVQSWVQDLDYATYPTDSNLLRRVDHHILDTVNHYKNKFRHWDVDNEMLNNNFYDRLGTLDEGRVHMFQYANVVDPNCKLFMNEYNGNSFGYFSATAYINRCNSLRAAGAPIHGIGIQGHINSPFGDTQAQSYWTNVLKPLGTLGLPIWVTEFDSDTTDEAQRAIDVENYYRICFSDPNVEGIIMWGFMVGTTWRANGQWGLVSSSGVLNAAGEKYEDLMDEWTTSEANNTDSNGVVNFRGFHGTYEITLSQIGHNNEVYIVELEPGVTTQQFIFDTNFGPILPEYDPPTPNPMTWASAPNATSSSTISMTATTATDATLPVQYQFNCITDSNKDSAWQTSATYTAEGLTPATSYSFRVRARDNQPIPNVTYWSSTLSATTMGPDANLVGSWVADTTHAKESGNNRILIFVAHEESISGNRPVLTSVTYGDQPMTKVIDANVIVSSNGNYVAAFMLKEPNIAAASSFTFEPNWQGTTNYVMYSSAFFVNVDQVNSIGATAFNNLTSATQITTAALATNNGDMVVLGATCGNNGNYTLNNAFIEGTDQAIGGSGGQTGVTGYKHATGAAETPSATFNGSAGRQTIIGFVLKQAAADFPPAAPTNLTAEAGNEVVTLNWDDNNEADLAGYNIYRSTTSGSDYSKLNVSLLTDSNYIDNTVTNGVPYFYVVKAVDDAANLSGYSDEATATPDYQDCNQVQAAGHGLTADLNEDCYVDSLDLKIIADNWLNTGCSSPDYCGGADFVPRDGTVNFADFSKFAEQWTQCNDPQGADCIFNW